jgi:hypothetical protein
MLLAMVLTALSWLANWEPIVVDNTAISVRPRANVTDIIDANPPGGTSFTEFRLSIQDGEVFRYLFWLHNDSPFPITVTRAGSEWGPGSPVHVTAIRLGTASGAHVPTAPPPYTIPPHGYAAIDVSVRRAGCLEGASMISLGTLPVSYEMFGFIHHDTTIVMPMTVTLVGTDGPSCP